MSCRHLRINRKEPSWSFPYLTKERNIWEMSTHLRPLSQGSLWSWTRWKVDAKNGPAQTLLVSPIYLFAFFQKPKTFFLCLITSLQIYSSLLICYIIPSTNHPFGLLTTVFLLCVFMIHVIINWFFFLFLVKKSNQDILLTLLTFF